MKAFFPVGLLCLFVLTACGGGGGGDDIIPKANISVVPLL